MLGGSFGYLLKQGAKNIALNAMMSLASIGVLVACMILMGCSYMFGVNVQSVIGYVETQNEVMVYIHREATDPDLLLLNEQIRAVDNLLSVTFVDKDTALSEWIDDMGEDGDVLEVFRYDNPLPNSYRVVVEDLSTIRDTVAELSLLPGVELVNAPYDVADSITNIKQGVDSVSNVIVFMLLLVSFAVLTNTIRLTVFSRRKEIGIMRYVGATDSFIRLPFLIEGILLGVISALISFIILWGGYTLFVNYIYDNPLTWGAIITEQLVPFTDYAFDLLRAFLVSGASVGTIGSMMFIGKYLKA